MHSQYSPHCSMERERERERAEQTTRARGRFAQNRATLRDYINFAQFQHAFSFRDVRRIFFE